MRLSKYLQKRKVRTNKENKDIYIPIAYSLNHYRHVQLMIRIKNNKFDTIVGHVVCTLIKI
jgi:hypothetical protein